MTIDEAINMFVDMSDKQKAMAVFREDEYSEFLLEEGASRFAQLAEWLRELRKIKHLFSVTEKLFKANFRGGLIDVVDGYDILFSEHKQLREIFEEVNSDE